MADRVPSYWITFVGPHGAKIEYMVLGGDKIMAWREAEARLRRALGQDEQLLEEWTCRSIEPVGSTEETRR